MKVKAVKTIATCITQGKEYEVIKESKDLIILGDDGYAVGLSRENFEAEEKVLTPVEWLSEQLLHLDIDFEMGMDKNEFQRSRKEIVEEAKIKEQELINK